MYVDYIIVYIFINNKIIKKHWCFSYHIQWYMYVNQFRYKVNLRYVAVQHNYPGCCVLLGNTHYVTPVLVSPGIKNTHMTEPWQVSSQSKQV
jgi:hypothetical protein